MDTWTADIWNDNEEECKRTLNEPGNWEKVPLLCDDKIPLGTFVRYKGMIQDMLNPEFYISSFKIVNSENDQFTLHQSKYHIATKNLQPGEEVVDGDRFMERHIYVCVPIPGLNEWAKDEALRAPDAETELEEAIKKRIRLDPALNPAEKKFSNEIFIFIYPEDIETRGLKLNQIVEVVGFLDRRTSQDATYGHPSTVQSSNAKEKETHIIHAVQLKLLDNLIPDDEEMYKSIWNDASNIRAELKFVLTQALLGDSLAADYLLFHLVSTIYNRTDNMVPGKLSLNIRGIPYGMMDYTKHLYSLITHLVVKSEYLPIEIDAMNCMNLIPRKCYSSDRLLKGMLQLSDRTHLILDEMNLQPGNVNTIGHQNLEALKNIIFYQQLKYDFKYYGQDYETNIPVLSLSIGKSLLPCDIDIVIKRDPSFTDFKETIRSVFDYLNSQLPLLDKLRKYIAIISTFPFDYGSDISKVIENDFVKMRKADPKNVSSDDLHRFMVISKLFALCSGKNELDIEVWESVKSLENQRKLRNS